MIKTFLPAVLAAGLFGSCLFGQGMNTKASKGDWEEINFEFNSSVLTDGYPSLLRISDLLKNHQEYKVRIVGNTDSIGSDRYNDKLAVSRANTVAQFLQKYGASSGQIQTSGQGKKDPEVPNRDKLGRWINRRVVLSVMDGSGNVIADGQTTMTATINNFEEDINKKLDKLKLLDDIISQLDALKNQVASIKGDTSQIAGLVSTSNSIKSDTTNLVARPAPLSYEQTQQIAKSAADYALTQSAIRNKKYSAVGANIGPTFMPGRTGNFSGSGFAKALIPFGNGKTPDQSGTHAVLLGGEYLYYPERQEGQFDIGLSERFRYVQATFTGSYMRSTFREYQGGASLGAASLILDFPFEGGKISLFGQKGLKNDTSVTRAILPIAGLIGLPDAFLKIEDQIGIGATVALGPAYFSASTAYKKSLIGGRDSRPTGTLKIVLPVSDMFAITAEGSVNETFQNRNDGGRVVFGFQFGNWLRPRNYNDTTAPIPTEVPRIHYELLRANRLNTP